MYADLRSRRGLAFKLPQPERPGATVFDVRGIELGFSGEGESRTLLPATDLAIERGEKIALLGRNGTGKSTLLHSLAAACIPLVKQPAGFQGGEIRVGYNVTARLLSQHDSELLDNQSLLGNMNHAAPAISRRDAMSLMGLFGFSGGDAERLVGTLSGGERRRLLLAMALTGSANVLLLDEPTNHLDIESREGLEAAIAEYAGTVILISHDRALVEGVATRTIVLHDQRLTTVNGGYTEARELLLGVTTPPPPPPIKSARAAGKKVPLQGSGSNRPANGAKKVAAQSGTAKLPATDGHQRTVRVSEGRRSGSKRRDGAVTVRRPGTIEGEIARLETELGDVQQLMLDPEVYTSAGKSADALELHSRLERDIASRYDELEKSLEHHGG